ncbi:sulfur oxidation c-type cytochrome SoxA [Candidatus Persebacteraceae bacterium Df01]|jgi:sulfur-oxidizing protein SoxA|uniref:SoxAX cytochrome complex subunit A n=1 Tax=Candidatus Doriopsillibacter californiensis TaxID=2970740 RepID=A0ABT7QJK4_9GAMM|nr:sulfur oxidation c-type cytochrome SoxA [Candidatus Persebacteraceae bacterium Df01]
MTAINRLKAAVLAVALATGMPVASAAPQDQPEKDRAAFVKYFQTHFPDVPLDDFVNGVYAIDQQAREQWEQIEEFPPYEEAIEKGEALYHTPFANGKGYPDCFGDGKVRHNYPYFDDNAGEVVTLEWAINQCRETNGETALKWERGGITALSAYMAHVSRGARFDIKVQSEAALAAYEEGKRFYYSKRGYLNNSCATCHVQGAGTKVRTEVLHPALGEVTHWPNFRLKWDHIATLHKRIRACHRDQGAKHFKAQSSPYRNVEYFMTFMSNGLPVNGPGVRK